MARIERHRPRGGRVCDANLSHERQRVATPARPAPAPRVDHVGRGDVRQGYQPILTPANAPLRELSVGRIRLDKKGVGKYTGETGDNEVLLHILVGQCTIEASGRWGRQTFKQLGERVDVFSGLPTSLVLGPRTTYTITPVTRTIDIAVASLPVGTRGAKHSDGDPPAGRRRPLDR